MSALAISVPVIAIFALIVAYGLASWVSKVDEGTDRMKEIAGSLEKDPWHFLKNTEHSSFSSLLFL